MHANTITVKGKMKVAVNHLQMGRKTHRFKICALCMFVCHLWLCNSSDSPSFVSCISLYLVAFWNPPVFKFPALSSSPLSLLCPKLLPQRVVSLPAFVYFGSVNWVVDRWEDTSSHKKLGRPLGLKFSSSFSLDRETDSLCDSPLDLCICSNEVWKSIAADIIRFVEFSHCSFLIIYDSTLISFSGLWKACMHICPHTHMFYLLVGYLYLCESFWEFTMFMISPTCAVSSVWC